MFCTGRFELKDELHQEDLKEKDEFILFFKIALGKIASAARNLINSSPQTEVTTFTFSSVFILLLCLYPSPGLNYLGRRWSASLSLGLTGVFMLATIPFLGNTVKISFVLNQQKQFL